MHSWALACPCLFAFEASSCLNRKCGLAGLSVFPLGCRYNVFTLNSLWELLSSWPYGSIRLWCLWAYHKYLYEWEPGEANMHNVYILTSYMHHYSTRLYFQNTSSVIKLSRVEGELVQHLNQSVWFLYAFLRHWGNRFWW